MLKSSDNPPVVTPGLPGIAAAAGRWWIAHTKPRFEKALAWDLLAKNVPYFLPMLRRVGFSGGRKRESLVPMYPSYCFFAGDDVARVAALSTGRLCRVIEVTDQPRLVSELGWIRETLLAGAFLDPYPKTAVGTRCRVTAGPFMGVEGVVVSRASGSAGRARLVLSVKMLGSGASLEIDGDLLEPVE